MGEALDARMQELSPQIPLGVEFGIVSLQSDSVTAAINSFVMSLLQAVAIVVIVLLFFMGLRSGLLIGFVLFLTIAASFIFMARMGVTLERISLGALIIALGMLVDNAIVIVDGMLVRIQQGMKKEDAALDVVKQAAWPLLGATVIAVLAFAAIGTSQDSTGEFTRSLYTVVLISLLHSWVTAVTVTPLLGVMFLEDANPDAAALIPMAVVFMGASGLPFGLHSASRHYSCAGSRPVCRRGIWFWQTRAKFLPVVHATAVHGRLLVAARHGDQAHRTRP